MRVLPLAVLAAGCIDRVELTAADQAATVCPQGPTIRGVDVSAWDGTIDWAAAHQSGIEFAFVRAGDGAQYVDPTFATNWSATKAAGVIRGAYQFFRPGQDPIEQAEVLLATMGALSPGDLPPVIDVEVSDGRSKAQVVTAMAAWIDHVAAAIGRQPIVYTGQYAWQQLTGSANFTTSPLWLAQYTTASCPYLPAPWTTWAFWQTSEAGAVAGIGGEVDLDVFNGGRDELLAFAGARTCRGTSCVEGAPDDPDGAASPAADQESRLAEGCSTGRPAGWLLVLVGLLVRRPRTRKRTGSRRRRRTCRA